ncbi:hypothetical protein MMH89_02450 [Candidatus Comchoanobacter bicostacola]|uniref:Nucleoprotein n=1 Tax=Candidatus Comchoanobacter bicostacola TaxID=2919598 RepID=A0ABY5DJW1_9GAMM|nr:hypothetical protein [Candidatus Comchoanobacter bicostacola]UTC24087.1 hypothetical protein MMH89_02450 [Candidatus Comchoanobacter bicostacola]
MSLIDTMKLRFGYNDNKTDSKLYLKGILSFLKSTDGYEAYDKIIVGKLDSIAFIKFKDDGYQPLKTTLVALFKKYKVDYQPRNIAPYGIHIKNFSEQTAKLYDLYKEFNIAHAEQELATGIINLGITTYHLKIRGHDIVIKRTPTQIELTIGGCKLITAASLTKKDINGIRLQRALELNINMSEPIFASAIYQAGINIVRVVPMSFPGQRLFKHFTEQSTLLVSDVITWISKNASMLSPRINMLNAALLTLQSEHYLIQGMASLGPSVSRRSQKAREWVLHVYQCFNRASSVFDAHIPYEIMEKILSFLDPLSKGHELRTQSYARQTYAAFRAQTDARMCRDKTCVNSADQMTTDFKGWIGGVFSTWATGREDTRNRKFAKQALDLFVNCPPEDYQPWEMAYSSDQTQSGDLFKSEKKCKEIVVEEQQALQIFILEQNSSLVIKV